MTDAAQGPVRHFTGAWRTGARRNRERFDDGKIHGSALHECPRQLQARYRRERPTDEVAVRLGIRAQIGAAIHEHYLPLLAEQWAGDVEVDEVEIEPDLAAGPLVAHPDLLVAFTDGTIAIIEVKTGNKALVDAALSDEPKRQHLDQCRVGGLLAEQHTGSPMRGYWIYHLDIEDPERHWALTWRSWTDEQFEAATGLSEYAAGLAGPETAPRWFGRHSSDAFQPFSPCLSCEFVTGCLGKDGADPVRAEAAAELVDAGARFDKEVKVAQDELAEFLRLQGIVNDPKRYKSYVGDVVKHLGLEPGRYRVGGVERRLVQVSGHDRLDGAAAKEMIKSFGKHPPMQRVAGHVKFE